MTLAERFRDIEPEQVRLLKRAEYELMIDEGLFADERVELLRGVIVEKSPQDPLHAGVTQILTEKLVPALTGQASIRIQLPLALSEDALPEPDVAIVPAGDYRQMHPTTALLVIEVAGASLRKDRTLKSEMYAEAGILEYWVVNLRDRVVEVHTHPRVGLYENRQTVRPGEVVHLQSFPDIGIAIADLVG